MPRLEKCHSTKKTKTLSRKRLTFCQIPSPRYPPPSPPSSPVWTQYREDYPLEVDLSAQTETLDHYPSLENLSPAYDHLAPLNHSFLDLPRLSREPSFSPVLPGSLLSMGTTQTSLPACSTPVASPTFAVGMSIPKKVTPIFKASPDSSLPGVLKELSSFSPVNCLPYTSRLLDAQKKPSLMPKKEEVLKRKATDLTSLIPLERQLDPETSPPSPKRFKSNEASTQVCATELLPLPLSINDLRNMGLSSVCPGSQALIGSELCPPKCCMCGAPQDWERQRLSKQFVLDAISDTTLSHQEIAGLTDTINNQLSSSTNSQTIPSLVISGTDFVIPIHQLWRLRELSSLMSAPTTSFYRIAVPTTSTPRLRLKLDRFGTLFADD